MSATAPGWAVELRRELHAHPELRFTEQRTAARAAGLLREWGYSVQEQIGGTGVVATLDSGRPGRHVAVRADLDALPIDDAKTVDYHSTVPGIMHACGHDVHVTVVLGLARELASVGLPTGRLTVFFQPAEEIPFGEASGAQAMLDAGLFDQRPDAVFGLHCWPQLDAGSIGVDDAVAMAAKDAFSITMTGRSAHAATPSAGADALLAMSQLVIALHTLVGRRVDAHERVALNVGTIEGGHSQSVLPDVVTITGTVRSIDAAARDRMRAAVEQRAAGIAAAGGCAAEVTWANEMPAVRNDAELVGRALALLPEVATVVAIGDPPMTTDDFALYAEKVPGLYLKLGVRAPGSTDWPALHTRLFDVDETCLPTGIAALSSLVRDALTR